MVHVALSRRRQHGARAEEQQALEERMVERVQQARGQGQSRGADMPNTLNANASPSPMKMMPMFSTVL